MSPKWAKKAHFADLSYNVNCSKNLNIMCCKPYILLYLAECTTLSKLSKRNN